MTDFKLIVFDWDGTLMDSEARIVSCLSAAVCDLGLPERDAASYRNIIGLSLADALASLFPDQAPSVHMELVERYRHHFLVADPTPSALFDGAADTLRRLAEQGYLLAVATGKGRRGLDKVLEETGLGAFFHATRCADETLSKPNPEMLLQIMDVLGVEATETLMVGDTEYDMLLARNAGTPALAVSYGVHALERLLKHEPLGYLERIGDLPPWIDNYRTGLSRATHL